MTPSKVTETEAVNAANVFLANLQTLNQGGIKAEDYDKIDFVKRGKTITISARVEAFYRAAARKNYRITDTIVAIPKEDCDTTYFREEFANGDIVYVLEDKRINPDRKITAERIANGYFSKFICRLTVVDLRDGTRFMSECEMSSEEMLDISNTGEQGIYKTQWVELTMTNVPIGATVTITALEDGTYTLTVDFSEWNAVDGTAYLFKGGYEYMWVVSQEEWSI